jgi:peptidoglycan/xylan/chitin deacetylase (PgdA/CDA1 family)
VRLITAVSAITACACVAIAGVVLAQRSSAPVPADAAAAPTAQAAAATPIDDSATVGTGGAARTAAAVPTVVAQASPPKPAAPTAQAPAAPATAGPAIVAGAACPGNPNALGVSRVVEVDTTGGPGFGSEQFKTHDFLREGEIVLTFDDGPWPKNTQAVLAALAAHCTRAIFFPIGLHTTYEPGILKQVAAAGHIIGSHTWCHQNLSKTKGRCNMNGKVQQVTYDPKDEIERAISAVHWAVGGPTAPFFRFPGLNQPPEMVAYLGQRNIAIFSADIDSFDFKLHKPDQVRQSVLSQLKKHGKGILLMHDFQRATAEGLMTLLNDLKAGGYKVVVMKPKNPVTTIASYDEWVTKQVKGATSDDRPTSSVIRTISE